MYLSQLIIHNFRCFGEGPAKFSLDLKPGLTALVGENDGGKTAVIDALRFALGTTDQEAYRLDISDFNSGASSREITITCKFEGLTAKDQRAFVEYLTYGEEGSNDPVLYLNWSAKDLGVSSLRRSRIRVECHSGIAGDGPMLVTEVRELLQTTYLRPLRDAEKVLAAGRGSRLSQVLHNTEEVRDGGVSYDPEQPLDVDALNVLGIGDLANALLQQQKGILETKSKIDTHLKTLSLSRDEMRSNIKVSGTKASDDLRLRQLLEKLDLILEGTGRLGLGSNNLLFMACELLLLAQEDEGTKLLLIEEPEAHLHAQRQLRVMKSLQEQAKEQGIQIIVTTHSPNLASAIALNNLVMIRNKRGFSLAEGLTALSASDYRFLERFLDVTKANLFFASGIMIVEGDAENILLPVFASLLGKDFTKHGVSIVNVGGIGLRRYARIFQRKDPVKDGTIGVPVACLADMDVMPNCAPEILDKVAAGAAWPSLAKRRWRTKSDFPKAEDLSAERVKKSGRACGQAVKTFVSDEWTLEYDLALGPKGANDKFGLGLGEDIFIAAALAEKDEAISEGKIPAGEVEDEAAKAFAEIKQSCTPIGECTAEEVLATKIMSRFVVDRVSKAVAAQYLAGRLQAGAISGGFSAHQLRERLPNYITQAIDYVTDEGATGAQA